MGYIEDDSRDSAEHTLHDSTRPQKQGPQRFWERGQRGVVVVLVVASATATGTSRNGASIGGGGGGGGGCAVGL